MAKMTEEGNIPEFWDNDIDSEVDDLWHKKMEKIINPIRASQAKLKHLIDRLKLVLKEEKQMDG